MSSSTRPGGTAAPEAARSAAFSSELSDHNPQARDALAASFTAWATVIREGLLGMLANGALRPQTDADQLALALLAAIQPC
jgi:TetR/AcrR family transcriptional regulator, transcriptional repressor for nem operon